LSLNLSVGQRKTSLVVPTEFLGGCPAMATGTVTGGHSPIYGRRYHQMFLSQGGMRPSHWVA
jgi:hypothetical protein